MADSLCLATMFGDDTSPGVWDFSEGCGSDYLPPFHWPVLSEAWDTEGSLLQVRLPPQASGGLFF